MTVRALPIPIPNPFGGSGVPGAGQVIKWIVQGVTKAIDAFFGDLVKSALKPLLDLLGRTLLTTPDLDTLPRIGELWERSRVIAVSVYALLILVAGIVVMAYETVQTRHSVKEVLPRIAIGFLAANLSLILARQAVRFANAVSSAVLGQNVSASTMGHTLATLVSSSVSNGGIFLILIGLALAVMLLALLVGYVIRVAATVILVAGAPLALMCHALPQTEAIARWWWRAFAGVLAIQLAQSLTLIAALQVFLGKDGFTLFGPTKGGLVNLIVTLALLYILWKIPFWIWHHVQTGHGRSFTGGLIKGLIAYKTLGLITHRHGHGQGWDGHGRFNGTGGPRRPGGPRPRGGPNRPRGPGGGPGGPVGPLAPAGGNPTGPRPFAGAAPTPRPADAAVRPAGQPHRVPWPAGRPAPGRPARPREAPRNRPRPVTVAAGRRTGSPAAPWTGSSRPGTGRPLTTPVPEATRTAPAPAVALPRLPVDLPRTVRAGTRGGARR